VTDDDVRDYAKSKNASVGTALDGVSFMLQPADQLAATVKADVARLRAEPSLAGTDVYGFMLDTATGVLSEVHM
jgi:hypothetical protein